MLSSVCLARAEKQPIFRSKMPIIKLMGLEKRFLRAKNPDHRHRDQASSSRYHAAFPRSLEPEQ